MKVLALFMLLGLPAFAQVVNPGGGGGGGSLPTATTVGQAPVSTGAGTTYTAQTVATPATANIWSYSGTASTPAATYNGAPFAGSATTSLPLLYMRPTGITDPTTFPTAGTFLGVDCSSTSQDALGVYVNGTPSLRILCTTATATIVAPNTLNIVVQAGTTTIAQAGLSAPGYGVYGQTFALAGGMLLGPSGQFGWGASFAMTPDVGFSRLSAGNASLDSSTAGNGLGTLALGQVIPVGTAPTMAPGAAAGTSPTCTTVTGHNQSMVVSCTTGTATTTGTLATVTFAGTLANAPTGCHLTPRNAISAPAMTSVYTTAPNTTTFTLAVATALTASTAYSWSVICL